MTYKIPTEKQERAEKQMDDVFEEVKLLPCPFCGGKASDLDETYNFFIEHDSWQCPMANASKEVFQLIPLADAAEWNERYEPLKEGR